jgi:hypothetical protein
MFVPFLDRLDAQAVNGFFGFLATCNKRIGNIPVTFLHPPQGQLSITPLMHASLAKQEQAAP